MSIRDELTSHRLSHLERTNKKIQAVTVSNIMRNVIDINLFVHHNLIKWSCDFNSA